MSYNIHQLLHLSLCVQRWRPLWATSAFSFESQNGILAKSIHGTKHLGQEMVINLKVAEGAKVIMNKSKSITQNFLRNKETFKYSCIGKKVRYENNAHLLLSVGFDPKPINFYTRATINNEIYTSTFYKITKSNNYTIELIVNDKSSFYGTVEIFFVGSDDLYFIVKTFDIDQSNFITHDDTEAVVNHIIPVTYTNNFKFINIKQVKYISHLIRVGKYVCKKPNNFKTVL